MGKKFAIRDFLNLPDKDIYESASYFNEFINQFNESKEYPYGAMSKTGVGHKMDIVDYYSGNYSDRISFVSSNYLGMSNHPLVKQAAIDAIQNYGTGTCAAPPIG